MPTDNEPNGQYDMNGANECSDSRTQLPPIGKTTIAWDRNIDGLRASMVQQKENVDKLLGALGDLIDRIPPQLVKNRR